MSEKSLSRLEDTLTAVLADVADAERKEAEQREKQEKAELRRRRKMAAAGAAEAKAKAAEAEAVAAAAREAEEARPLAEKVATGMGSLLEIAIKEAAEAAQTALDPASAEVKAAVAAAAANAAKEEAASEAAWVAREEAERKRKARRFKKLSPAAEQFTVRLVRGLPGQEDAPQEGSSGEGDLARTVGSEAVAAAAAVARGPRERSRLVGSVILVDSLHPDFKVRWRQTRQGAPKVDDRLCGYLATIVSSHYRERAYQSASRQRVDYAQAYEEMIGTYCRLEDGLRAVLPALLREMNDEYAREGSAGGGDGA